METVKSIEIQAELLIRKPDSPHARCKDQYFDHFSFTFSEVGRCFPLKYYNFCYNTCVISSHCNLTKYFGLVLSLNLLIHLKTNLQVTFPQQMGAF